MSLFKYIPLCNALVRLMDPLMEIVIHDIKKDVIVYINGKLSARKVGDPSLLDLEGLDTIDDLIYPKINFDGKLVKSISVLLEEKWLLCANCDISIFSKFQDLSKIFLQNNHEVQPLSLFKNDWQEKLHVSIHSYLKNHYLSFDHLNRFQKKALIKHLFALGAFQERNAADYIAKILHLSRATIFNYLKEWKNQ